MLDQVRTYASHWALKLMLGVIALVFVFFGFGNMDTSTNEYAARVNGKEIPFDQFQREFEQQMSQRRPQPTLPEDLQEQMVIGQVLDSLIEVELLRQFAEEMEIYVSKEELEDHIKERPDFQDEESKKFIGRKAYLKLLEDNNRDVADFEESLRDGLLVQKAKKFIEGSVKITPDEIKDEWVARNEKANLQFLRIDAASLAESLKGETVKDDAIAKFEAERPGLVETLYSEEKDSRWTTPAKAKLRQITVKKPAAGKGDVATAKRKADRVLEQATADWKKAAEQLSEGAAWEKTGEAKEMARREMPALLAEKVFAMTPADPATIVETPTSFVIVKIESTTPEKVTELDEKVKREIIVEQIKNRRAEEMVDSFAKEAFAKLKAGEKIEKVAALKGLAVKETGVFTARQSFPGLPEADPAMVAAAFKLAKPGDVLDVGGEIPKAGAAYILASLKEHVVPDEKEFDDQKIWVRTALERVKSAEVFRSWKVSRLASTDVERNTRLLPTS